MSLYGLGLRKPNTLLEHMTNGLAVPIRLADAKTSSRKWQDIYHKHLLKTITVAMWPTLVGGLRWTEFYITKLKSRESEKKCQVGNIFRQHEIPEHNTIICTHCTTCPAFMDSGPIRGVSFCQFHFPEDDSCSAARCKLMWMSVHDTRSKSSICSPISTASQGSKW